MKVLVEAYGETPMAALERHVVLVDQVRPEPGEGEVLVEVRSAAVGWVDLLMTSGQYQHMAPPPYTPGLEYTGVVAELGPGVSGLDVGDRVIADGFRTGPRSSGAHRRWGGFATWTLAPAEALLPLPEQLSFDQGACLLGNYETAYHCLIARGRIQPGETVLVHGASGSTGLAAVHVAKAAGARVIATGRSPEKLAVVKAQGADHVVRSVGRFREEVKAICPRGVDLVYDGVGGEISLESLRCVRFGARFLIVGWASTPFVARGKGQRGAPNANVLPTNLLMMKGLDVLGCPTIISTVQDPSIRGPRLAWILDKVELGDLAPYIDASYPLPEVHEAMRAKWSSLHVGGCVLRCR
ncbi:MAG TPA: NADPH:quinone oxidoreductase family protein [Myxococcota bacterium]|nr:NADPH:quinone oxidoreductase family protein [Myxococcota bacterium]